MPRGEILLDRLIDPNLLYSAKSHRKRMGKSSWSKHEEGGEVTRQC